jgi:uncharacterized protein
VNPLDIVFPLLTGLLAGGLGALLGLGGGVVVVPTLEIFGSQFMTTKYALNQIIAASQIGVLSVSIASSAGYLRQGGFVRLRDAYRLSPFTVLGGIVGSLLLLVLDAKIVATVFALLLLYTGLELVRGINRVERERIEASPWTKPALGFGGVMSGLLGIGGGTVQVPVLNLLMGMPFRAAIATSTFMMGFTAIANASIQLASGKLEPALAGPVALGILIGARLMSGVAKRIPVRALKILFSVLVFYSAYDLLHKYWRLW